MTARSATDGRKEKSVTAFRTISEVADKLGLPQHVLRFWETKFQVIKPMKRGGGRRYYRPEDIDILRRIRSLLYDEGYTIKGVQKLLRNNAEKKKLKPDNVSPEQEVAFIDEGKRRQLEIILDDLRGLRKFLPAS